MNMDPKAIGEVTVYRRAEPIGTLKRTPKGASFTYLDSVVAAADPSGQVASTMPIRKAPYVVQGDNLHPFFAGLLPEGARHQALVSRLKTSRDDLFSLLLGAGEETIGDVWIAKDLQAPTPEPAWLGPQGEMDFAELLERSLGGVGLRDPKVFAGVQPKVSDAMISLQVRRKTKGRESILKLAPPSHPQLVENEAFFMELANTAGMDTAHCRVLHDNSGRSALLVERFDRHISVSKDAPLAERATGFLHLEDACQLLDRYPADKYHLKLREIANALELCSAPISERLRLLRLYAFSYLIANGDLHGKNISVLWSPNHVTLSPVYDVLSTLPYGDDAMALKLGSRDKNIKRKDFVEFGESIGIKSKATADMLDKLIQKVAPAIERLDSIGLTTKQTAFLGKTIHERLVDLSAGA